MLRPYKNVSDLGLTTRLVGWALVVYVYVFGVDHVFRLFAGWRAACGACLCLRRLLRRPLRLVPRRPLLRSPCTKLQRPCAATFPGSRLPSAAGLRRLRRWLFSRLRSRLRRISSRRLRSSRDSLSPSSRPGTGFRRGDCGLRLLPFCGDRLRCEFRRRRASSRLLLSRGRSMR